MMTCLSLPTSSVFGQDSATANSTIKPTRVASLSPLTKLPSVITAPDDKEAQQRFNELLTNVAREQIPHTFTDKDDWGATTTRWDGVELERDGWRLKTKRRKKEVNHGHWKRVDCRLLNPEQEFAVSLSNIRTDNHGRTIFDVDVVALLNLEGRVSRWVKGVQVYSVSAEANAKVHLKLTCSTVAHLELKQFPPDVRLQFDVTDSQLELQQFDVYRISKVGGEVANQIGDRMRKILEKKIDEKQERLTQKINAAIDKREDRLRFSLHDTLTEQLGDRLPDWFQANDTETGNTAEGNVEQGSHAEANKVGEPILEKKPTPKSSPPELLPPQQPNQR